MPAAPDRKINDASANQLIVWDTYYYFIIPMIPSLLKHPGPALNYSLIEQVWSFKNYCVLN